MPFGGSATQHEDICDDLLLRQLQLHLQIFSKLRLNNLVWWF